MWGWLRVKGVTNSVEAASSRSGILLQSSRRGQKLTQERFGAGTAVLLETAARSAYHTPS